MEQTFKVHVSTTIHKLNNSGTHIGSFNLPAGVTCPADAPCREKCYAMHGRFLLSNVQKSYRDNLNAFLADPEKCEEDILSEIDRLKLDYFRWHGSGDFVNFHYFEMVVDVAKKRPNVTFLVFTKKSKLVNRYLDEHNGILPANLHVWFSNWGRYIHHNR